MRGEERLADIQSTAAFVGITIAPVLLTAGLGVPSRFFHLLRVFKPTSPMSVGTWTRVSFAGATTLAARRMLVVDSAGLVAGGYVLECRMEAGKQSALDPRYVVEPQRSRIDSRGS